MAQEVIRQGVDQHRVDDIVEASKGMFDVMGVVQHHDAITGTDNQKVADDYSRMLIQKLKSSDQVYENLISDRVQRETGLKIDGLITCAQNETEPDCPAFSQPSLQSFIVVAYNAKAVTDNQFIRIALPSNSYRAEIWDGSSFKKVNFDILEQLHFRPGGNETMNFEMFIDYPIQPNDLAVVQVSKTEQPHIFVPKGSPVSQSKSSLEISGFTEQNEALFKFKNSESGISQSFGISLRKWNSKKAA